MPSVAFSVRFPRTVAIPGSLAATVRRHPWAAAVVVAYAALAVQTDVIGVH